MSGIIIDLVIVAVIVIAILIGRKKGLAMTLFSLLSILISVVLSFVFQPIVSNGLNYFGLQEIICKKLHQPVSKCCADIIAEGSVASYESLAEKINLPVFLISKLPDKEITADLIQGSNVFNEKVSEVSNLIAELFISVISFFIVAVLVMIAITCISFGLKLFSKLPAINKFDKTGGSILGFLIGLVICFAVLASVQVVNTFVDFSFITNFIDKSYICKLFYENNLLLLLAIILQK